MRRGRSGRGKAWGRSRRGRIKRGGVGGVEARRQSQRGKIREGGGGDAEGVESEGVNQHYKLKLQHQECT
jgi:hypothetical protein